MITVVEARIVATRGGLRRPVDTARGRIARRTGLLLQLVADGGLVGQGEASPLPGISPDTVAGCAEELRRLQPGLGRRVARLDPGAPVLPQVRELLDALGFGCPAARFAAETALLDLAGQRLGVPLSTLLSGAPPAPAVPLSALVHDVASAREAAARGIGAVKLKIGRAGEFPAELALARAIRDELGDRVALRLDANGGFSPDEAAARLGALAPLRPEFVEEPVWAPELLARLSPSPVPLAADESLARQGTWPLVARSCRVAVLKPMLLGGLARCLDLARRAEADRLRVVVTHCLDGPVALAAAAELALALPAAPLACGLAPHAGLAAWPRLAVPQLAAAAVVPTGRPGLGLATLPLGSA